MVYADLHVHTDASDGLLSLEEVVEEVRKQDVKAVALTDHDTINPGLEDRYQVMNTVEVVTGAEVKAVHRGVEIEILCYFLDPEDNELNELFEEMNKKRLGRMKKMVERFNSLKDGVRLDMKDVVGLSKGSVGRPHFVRAIMEKGLEENFWGAFDKYASKDSKFFVPLEKPDAGEVIERAGESGVLTSLAHPCKEDIDDFEKFIKSLEKIGLDGCEVDYSYHRNKGDLKLEPNKVKEIVESFGLMKTGGSDFHDRKNFVLGGCGISRENFMEMKKAAEFYD